jgi:hypothetical protein
MITYWNYLEKQVSNDSDMADLFEQNEEKRGVNKGLIIGGVIGIIVIAVLSWLVLMKPPVEEQKAKVLEGAVHEDSPEFPALTKDIIIATDRDTVESPNAFGTISMFIKGNIYNKGKKVIDGLEVNVAVVDQFNKVLKEKRSLVVPTKQPTLNPGETIAVNLTIDGFDKNDDRANIRWKVTAIRLAAGSTP